MRGPPRLLAPGACAVILGVIAVPRASAQLLGVSVRGVVSQTTSTLKAASIEERISGIRLGFMADLTVGPVTLSGVTLDGALAPGANAFGFEQNTGEVRGVARITPTPWLGLEGMYTLRRIESPLGLQEWQMAGGGVYLSTSLGHESIRTYVRGMYLGLVDVWGRPNADLGIAAEGGIILRPHGVPFRFGAHYRFERYDFPATSPVPVEQFEEVMLEVGFGIGR